MEVEFLVDTGAAMVCLPISSIQAMGLKPLHSRSVSRRFSLAFLKMEYVYFFRSFERREETEYKNT
jgi:hypothetical protein